ncbi:Eco57I restriction-modification methylase domain-containing protein [Leeuwenhoekiella marinoflava]|uniref:site-specific DNA-methyltransferase (adenine-specific) n=2 Tax=Leeuwenhoekiella marinoflava TaxID=988 RepID=A0A4Q0PQ13_9FLAO|nr:N-6 DNA methylase [Leeuwenhoekiella marinoflava]RXG31925.1 adenine-specific DNA-methyltransferase [Leeuwenhoekiella marinoflava]SHE91879.1 adenine-specific DNA-methyltransferase [Leeuwenhoekiella marinoflava DSM 3653]
MNKKSTGSYYTPEYLASFISKRVLSHFGNRTRISILEPSVGDGAFISELEKERSININLTALDINNVELKKAKDRWSRRTASFEKTDFLEFATIKQYSAVVGNPPYVKKNILTSKQIELSKEIHSDENLTEASVKNIWTTFLVKANTLLAKNGVLAFVLPSELLQVKFAEEIREYLKAQFERIEIFTFNDLMFECKGQDTIVLFAYKKSKSKGEYFVNITSKESLEKEDFILRNNQLLVSSKVKWTHHFLSDDELNFIDNIKRKLKTVNFYTDSKPGIVTAANNFFILNNKNVNFYNLSEFTRPIIQKGKFVNGSVVFNNSDLEALELKEYPTKLLKINNTDILTENLQDYIDIGEKQDIHRRYKCKLRNKWYVIPNVSDIPEAFFFKRSHLYPKLLKNNTNALVTDSAYAVKIKENYNLDSFIYSFYNTFTLLLSEIEGRYYGGGVLELVPSEFKKLPIPYIEISSSDFEDYTTVFKNKGSIEDILSQNDLKILNTALGIDSDDIKKLERIRFKLKKKRLRN